MNRHQPSSSRCGHYGRCDRTPRLDAQKTIHISEQNQAARLVYRERIEQRSAEDFVIVDEFGSNLNLTSRYARAPHGQRALGRVPRNTPPNRTVIASLSLDGMGPSMLLVGATDRLAFEAYVEQVLTPTLREGQLVVMDNLSAHQSTQVEATIAARDCELWFLPPYSPDLSPIEMAFAKVKEGLRRQGAREGEALERAIMEILPTVSSADAHGFFTACAYLRRQAESQSL